MKDSGMMTMTINLADNAMIELCGDNCKLWLKYGLPDYDGSIDGLKVLHNAQFQELLQRGAIKEK